MNFTESTDSISLNKRDLPKVPKILIVEDEQLVRWSLAQSLSKAGFEIATATNGEKAIERIKDDHFDLVITDYNLPNINGFEVASAVKSCSPNIPVILTSAYGKNDSRLSVNQAYFDSFIEKPYDLNDVKDIVMQLLNENWKLA